MITGHNEGRRPARGGRPSATGGNKATNGKALLKSPLITGLLTKGYNQARRPTTGKGQQPHGQQVCRTKRNEMFQPCQRSSKRTFRHSGRSGDARSSRGNSWHSERRTSARSLSLRRRSRSTRPLPPPRSQRGSRRPTPPTGGSGRIESGHHAKGIQGMHEAGLRHTAAPQGNRLTKE